jgi:hypothetical protein
MRKLLKITFTFALTLVFTAGTAFGQTEGVNAEVDLDQEGGGNEALIDQTVNDYADVDQTNGAFADIFQGYGTSDRDARTPNRVDLDQTGDNAEAYINQSVGDAAVDLKQKGDAFADIDQTEGGAVTGIGANDNTANQNANGGFVEADIDVNSPFTTVEFEQYGSGNDIDLTHTGFNEEVTIRQGKEGAMSGQNEADILSSGETIVKQTGAGDHLAEVDQGSGFVEIEQSGYNHKVNVDQERGFQTGSSTADIKQTGTPQN